MAMINRLLGAARPSVGSVLAIDRIACTGHGICAHILTGTIELDEWGYPILHEEAPDPALAAEAVKLCPAKALRWVERRDVRSPESGLLPE
ncbi:ferredoxin [Nocardia vermiculata]|uniref:Ferredoxin n=2 Tax=Nocardia vermiculata TaxID=257274 RepID=A0A846XWH6_9NOCA|nr:ferredoxin [Nocardia vermiculata]